MKTIKTVLLFLCAAVLSASCSKTEIRDSLRRAETLMSERPDSALAVIYGIDTLKLKSSKDIALYSLLRTQAEDKNYIDAVDDSRILRAVEYYSGSSDDYHKMLSYYYLGRVQENAGEYSKAIVSLLKAEKAGLEIQDDFYLGLIYRACSEIYNEVYINVESIKYARRSYESFKNCGKENYINWALIDLWSSYNNGGKCEEAVELASQIIQIAEASRDTLLLSYGLRYAGISNIGAQHYNESVEAYTRLFSECPDLAEESDYIELGVAYLYDNQFEKAKILLDSVEKRDTSNRWLSYELYAKQKDYEKAFYALQHEYKYQDNILRKILEQDVTETVLSYRDFEEQQKDAQLSFERKSKLVLISVGILIIVLLSVILLQLSAAYKKDILAKMTMMSQLQSSLDNREGENANLQSAINILYGQNFKTIDELCSEYYAGKDKNAIVKKVGVIIKGFKEDRKTIAKLEAYVNTYRNDVVQHFREDFPNLKDTDYKFFLYLAAGFSLRTICVFLDSELEPIYSKKFRLKQKISKSDLTRKEEYMEIIA